MTESHGLDPVPVVNRYNAIASEPESDDDEGLMVKALQQVAHKVQVGQKPSQRTKKLRDSAPLFNGKLSSKQIQEIVAAVNKGDIKLPELDLPTDEDYVTVWSLADTGSAVHVADAAKHFPGAKVRKSQAQTKGVKYESACGGKLANKGEFDIKWRAPDGKERVTTFQNAEVGLPIFSVSHVARDKHRVVFEDDGGHVVHKPTGSRFDFIISSGVCFIKMRVPRSVIEDTPVGRHGIP